MEASIKRRATTIIVMMFFILMTAAFLSGVYAQPRYASNHPIEQVKNAGKDIDHHDEVNLTAKAIALNPSINGPFAELKPALSPDGKRLYFSRHVHPDNTNGAEDMEDIWYSEFDATSNTWGAPALMLGTLNNAGPNFINNVSVTGDTVILGNQYLKNGKMRAGLSYSVRVNGEWNTPKNIHIKHDYNISNQANAFVSVKNGVIISAIQRSETYGARDLYVSFWDGHTATEPINMGSILNTEFEESSPFLDSDNKTLYFASKGHHGHGGYDIWVSTRLDDSWTNWSEPKNLGPAVNGAHDDEFFSITHCGNYAIFSKEVSVHNIDLFRISVEELFTEPVQREIKKDGPVVSASLAAL